MADPVGNHTPVTPRLMVGQIRRRHFAVLSTAGRDGAAHSAGVSYGCTKPGDAFVVYVMTRRHLLKARNIESDPRVSVVIPVPRPVLTFLPPATIQLHGQAELLNWDDPIGTIRSEPPCSRSSGWAAESSANIGRRAKEAKTGCAS